MKFLYVFRIWNLLPEMVKTIDVTNAKPTFESVIEAIRCRYADHRKMIVSWNILCAIMPEFKKFSLSECKLLLQSIFT